MFEKFDGLRRAVVSQRSASGGGGSKMEPGEVCLRLPEDYFKILRSFFWYNSHSLDGGDPQSENDVQLRDRLVPDAEEVPPQIPDIGKDSLLAPHRRTAARSFSILEDAEGEVVRAVSEVQERDGKLWLGAFH